MATFEVRFGEIVKSRRKARGMTQAQLAEASSMSEEWVSRLERGMGAPSFEALDVLANALGVSVADLFAPMTSRDVRLARLDALLLDRSDAELEWLEALVRTAVAKPHR